MIQSKLEEKEGKWAVLSGQRKKCTRFPTKSQIFTTETNKDRWREQIAFEVSLRSTSAYGYVETLNISLIFVVHQAYQLQILFCYQNSWWIGCWMNLGVLKYIIYNVTENINVRRREPTQLQENRLNV